MQQRSTPEELSTRRALELAQLESSPTRGFRPYDRVVLRTDATRHGVVQASASIYVLVRWSDNSESLRAAESLAIA